jgi:hypothetical protein
MAMDIGRDHAQRQRQAIGSDQYQLRAEVWNGHNRHRELRLVELVSQNSLLIWELDQEVATLFPPRCEVA